jgi:hypothetical protein
VELDKIVEDDEDTVLHPLASGQVPRDYPGGRAGSLFDGDRVDGCSRPPDDFKGASSVQEVPLTVGCAVIGQCVQE